EQDLATSIRTLNDTAFQLLGADLLEPAETLLERATGLCEIHKLQEPDAPPYPLIHVLDSLASLRARQGEPQQAADLETHAVDLFEPLAKDDPEGFLGPLALTLERLARYLSEADRSAEALTYQRRAVDINEKRAAQNPDNRPSLAESLTNLGRLLEFIDPADSTSVLARAATLRAALPRPS
ncbi:MAG: hypothetical protein JWL97_4210, partial [Gemmatimonadales bacterium]|nr:hypothetical protein [Gemmatimonadales bacterium]